MHKCETLSQVSCTNDLLNEDGDSELLHHRKESIIAFCIYETMLGFTMSKKSAFFTYLF